MATNIYAWMQYSPSSGLKLFSNYINNCKEIISEHFPSLKIQLLFKVSSWKGTCWVKGHAYF